MLHDHKDNVSEKVEDAVFAKLTHLVTTGGLCIALLNCEEALPALGVLIALGLSSHTIYWASHRYNMGRLFTSTYFLPEQEDNPDSYKFSQNIVKC